MDKIERRSFLAAIVGIAAFFTGVSVVVQPKENYLPWGHVDMGTPGVQDIQRVELDGKELKHVFEFDDVAGWVRHYVDGKGGMPEVLRGKIRTVYRTGKVRAFTA